MELLYSNDSYKLNLYKRDTTIITTSDEDVLYLLNDLRSKNYNYISIYTPFSTDTVLKELSLFNEAESLLNLLGAQNLVTKNIKDLSIAEIAVVKIVIELSKKNDFVIFYDMLTYLNEEQKNNIIGYIKNKNITFINITSNEEEYLINDYMIVINAKQVALEGETKLVLEQEKILKRLGFSLPFSVDISLQLKAYGLIKNIYTDYKDLVGVLWKNKD